MATYSSIQVLPVSCEESTNDLIDSNCDNCCSEEVLNICEETIAENEGQPSLDSYSPCHSKQKDVCVFLTNDDCSQDIAMFDDDPRSISRLKMCNLMRSMQQTHIAELFPIMESKETTEGSEDQVICRICHTGGDEILIAPCRCIGSAQFVHATCLLTWFKKSVKNQCELCQHQVPIKKKRKPVSEWKKPEDKPIPLIWFMVFFVGLCLNILSIHVNASESCKSTACLIFYVVNGFGIVLDAAFLWFWWLKCLLYWRKWCAINQDWFITDTTKNHVTMVTYTKKSKSQEGLNPVVEAFEIENNLDGKVMV